MPLSIQIITAIAYAFAGCYIVYILFFYIGFRKLRYHKLKDDTHMPPLTVIVCAKDEEEHIEKCIQSILNQNYPKDKFSIIAVNDRSEDSTGEILINIEREDPQLKVLHIDDCPPGMSPKKNAISRAMEYCKTEYVVATDADTLHHKDWLRSYGSLCDDKLGVATGICIYEKESFGSKWEETWQSMQTIENLSYNVVIAGAMANGFAITAYGGNMLYRKEPFNDNDTLKHHVVSGDDSDIVYAAQKQDYNIVFNSHPASVVRLVPEDSIKGVINQHVRWASKVLKATVPVVIMMISIFLFYISAIFFPLLAIIDASILLYWGGLVLIKALCDFFYMSMTLKKFEIPFKFKHLFLMELVHAPFIVWIGIVGTFGTFTWKGTSYKKTL